MFFTVFKDVKLYDVVRDSAQTKEAVCFLLLCEELTNFEFSSSSH